MLLYPKWQTLLNVYKHLVAVTAYCLSNRLLLIFKFFLSLLAHRQHQLAPYSSNRLSLAFKFRGCWACFRCYVFTSTKNRAAVCVVCM